MTIAGDAQGNFNKILAYGDQVRFKYYNQSIGAGSYYDDDTTLTQSGTDLWTSGVQQPISSNQYSSDSVLLEQGKILLDDSKLYILGTTVTSGLAPIKVGIGSPVRNEYEILGQGQVTEWGINGTPIYKKIYARILNGGSFVGE